MCREIVSVCVFVKKREKESSRVATVGVSSMILWLLLVLMLPPCGLCKRLKRKCPLKQMKDRIAPLNYYQSGDYVVSGITSTTQIMFYPFVFFQPPNIQFFCIESMHYWKILPFLFAIHEINRDPRLLPNITLGYNVYENYFNERMTYEAMIDLLSFGQENIPNYSCGRQNNLLAVLEDTDFEISSQIATVLGIYKTPQVNYSFLTNALSGKSLFPFLHRMVPKKEPPYLGIVKLLLHFRWTWIGLLAPENDSGEKFRSTFTSLARRNGICIAFSEIIPVMDLKSMKLTTMALYLTDRKVNVVVCQLDTQSMLTLGSLIRVSEKAKLVVGKVLIATALQDLSLRHLYKLVDLQHTHVSLSFSIQTNKRARYDNFDQFLSDLKKFGEAIFHCSYSRPMLSVKIWDRCMEKATLKHLPQDVIERILSQDTYSIYNAIQAVARTLHAVYSSRSKHMQMGDGGRLAPQRVQSWQVSFAFI
ncbi:hypothetical protein JD844_013519 [Phrynosoma platyrhinos]|uniref:Receptor ligand binding region domain-containing protein n=1 Tax=Phrynosoma platyrhinos TaxID=52577 RepID=A0ABQ7TM15_PHRPL|nr:hypothetical protein JD844_013519 [Phrynosoma platyrhinos]